MEDDDVDETVAGPWPASTPPPERAGLKRDLEGSFMREEDEEEEREVKQMKRSAAAAAEVAPPRGGRSPSVAIGPCKWRRKGGFGFGGQLDSDKRVNRFVYGVDGVSVIAIGFWLYLRSCHFASLIGARLVYCLLARRDPVERHHQLSIWIPS